MLKARDYQLNAVNDMDALDKGCLVAATGSGKTMMGAILSWREVQRNGRVAFVVPRNNLAYQTAATFRKWRLPVGLVLGGEEENRAAKVQILSYQSLGSKKRSLDWVADQSTLWLIDEAHIAAFAAALQAPLAEAKRKFGVTATPWQMGGRRSLLDIFENPVFAPPPGELIERGYLSPPVYFRPKKKGKLDASPSFIWEQWERISYGERTFIFCGSIAESDETAKVFQENGINAVSVTSRTNPALVEPTFNRFKNGEVTVLVSCNKLAEGCDVPSASCVVLANRTESRSGAVQRIGRGARIYPGKTHFKVIDCVGIVKKFGRFEQIKYSREDFAIAEPKGGSCPEKQCETCGAWSLISQKVCLNCKKPFEIESTYEFPGALERLTEDDSETRAIQAFHALLLRDFQHSLSICEKEFFNQYGYYPPDHWCSDAQLPPAMRSSAADWAWRAHKRQVVERLPREPVQLRLPGVS